MLSRNRNFSGYFFSPDATIELSSGLKERLLQDVTRRSGSLKPSNLAAYLVPYDIDSNGHPGTRGGAKAHWCLVTGIAATIDRAKIVERGEEGLKEISAGLWLAENGLAQSGNLLEALASASTPLVVARQGKSRRLFFYNLEALVKSNRQLCYWNGSKEGGVNSYEIPQGGCLSNDLMDKMVRVAVDNKSF